MGAAKGGKDCILQELQDSNSIYWQELGEDTREGILRVLEQERT